MLPKATEVKNCVFYGCELRHQISVGKKTGEKDAEARGTRERGKAAEGRMQYHRNLTLNSCSVNLPCKRKRKLTKTRLFEVGAFKDHTEKDTVRHHATST